MLGPRGYREFGRTLASGSPFIKWTLSPVLLLSMILLPFLVDAALRFDIVMLIFELACGTLLAGFWLPRRYARWAYWACAAIVLGSYGTALVVDILKHGIKFNPHSALSNLGKAMLGVIVVAVFSRLTFFKKLEMSDEIPFVEEYAGDENFDEQKTPDGGFR